jgi:hypothetical protein
MVSAVGVSAFMASFTVVGPVVVPVVTGPGGKSVDTSSTQIQKFWNAAGCGGKAGCYVFGIRHGRGTIPYYAGKTTKKLAGECFQSHKLTKYHKALTSVAKGTPVMFFLVPAATRGRVNSTAIKSLEERLIGLGVKRNPDMTNIHGTKKTEIVIKGVAGSGRGKPTKSASAFRKMVGA